MSKLSTQRLNFSASFFGGTGIVEAVAEAHAIVVKIFCLFSVSFSIVSFACRFIIDCMDTIGWRSFGSVRGHRRMARYCQAIHGHQAIRGWPGSAYGPEQFGITCHGLICRFRGLGYFLISALCVCVIN